MNAPIINFPGGPGGDDQTSPVDSPEVHRGQLRFAERFTREHGGKMLLAHGLGWHWFDGTRWAQCTDGGEVRAAKATISNALRDLAHLDEQPRKELIADIGRVESHAGMMGTLAIAGSLHPCTLAATALDNDPHLLNTSSGTLDLRTSRQRAARPSDHLSKVTNARFDPATHSKVFDDFLETCQPDPVMRAFIARALGSSLLGLVREQKLFIWHGPGANGKGTLRDAVLNALGDGEYAVEVPADILLASKYGAQHLAPERMRLKGTRVAFCSEIPEGARLDEATMKKLTGGDPVSGKLLYRNPVTFDPSHTLFMLTNFLPVVRGDDPAVWRRILAVPFDVVVPAADRDATLPEKLRECPDAVLAWLWGGWLDYCQQGLNPPQAVLDATKRYEHDSDVLARFLDDETAVLHGHGQASSSAFYKAFQDWARAQGEPTEMTNKALSDAMEKRGHTKKRTKKGAVWQSVSLVSDQPGGRCGDDR